MSITNLSAKVVESDLSAAVKQGHMFRSTIRCNLTPSQSRYFYIEIGSKDVSLHVRSLTALGGPVEYQVLVNSTGITKINSPLPIKNMNGKSANIALSKVQECNAPTTLGDEDDFVLVPSSTGSGHNRTSGGIPLDILRIVPAGAKFLIKVTNLDVGDPVNMSIKLIYKEI